jgi:hypothetical protein
VTGDIGDLRQTIERDRARPAAMTLGSPGYRQLRRQIVRASGRLRALEEDAALRAHQATGPRLLSLLLGAVLVVAGWGSWRHLIGVAVGALGVWIAGRLPDHFYRSGLGFHRRAE